jgi:hypothetical protein
MAAALQVVGSFFAGAFAWVLLEFLGRPFRHFFDLRSEIIQKLIEFGNIRARYKVVRRESEGVYDAVQVGSDVTDAELARLEEAEKSFRNLAARMRAFSENETFGLWAIKIIRYDPKEASKALIALSNTYSVYGDQRARNRQRLTKALRLATDA